MTSLRLLVRPQARLDLLEIWHTIADDSPTNASKVTDQLELAIRDLARFPGIGHLRDDVKNKQYRFWTVHSWVIAYRYDDSTLTIVRVVHGARDFRRLFRSRHL